MLAALYRCFKSPNMEREGLHRARHALVSRVTVTNVTTDASTAILKMLGTTVNLPKS